MIGVFIHIQGEGSHVSYKLLSHVKVAVHQEASRRRTGRGGINCPIRGQWVNGCCGSQIRRNFLWAVTQMDGQKASFVPEVRRVSA